jgi:plastocyanin
MKKLYTLFLLASVLIANSASAVVVTINQSGNTFSPNAITTVNVGDVIHFVWSSGTHTTTSVSVPAGAASWDSPLSSSVTSFDYTVTVAGAYGYHCSFHATMIGGFSATAANSIEPVANITSDFSVGIDNNSHTLHVRIDNNSPSKTTMKMLDITGRDVAVLLETQLGMGEQVFHYDMADQVRGMYFIRMEQNGKVITRKVLMN